MIRTSVIEGYYEPCGYTQITDLSSAVGLGTIPAEAKLAIIQAETQSVRFRDDGQNPTAAVGMVLSAGDVVNYTGNLAAFKVIQTSASAKLNISFYK